MAAAFDASAAKVRWSEVGWAELEKEVRAFLEMRAKAAIGEKQRKRERGSLGVEAGNGGE